MLEMRYHPRIVQYYGYEWPDDGPLEIFMEYMTGVSELFTSFYSIFTVYSLL